jgi:hypothetical protein
MQSASVGHKAEYFATRSLYLKVVPISRRPLSQGAANDFAVGQMPGDKTLQHNPDL